MTNESRPDVDRRTAAWLHDGPSVAPDYLLDLTLERTIRAKQRSRFMALALGAPSDGAAAGHRETRRLVLAAILASLLLAGALIAGALREDDRLSVVPPIPPSPSPSARTSPRPAPSTSPPLVPISVVQQFEDPSLGFAFVSDHGGPSYQLPLGSDDATKGSVHFLMTTCSFCVYGVRVMSAPVEDGVAVDGKRVQGTSLASLKASWATVFGPTTFTMEVLAGQVGALADSEGKVAILLVHAGRDFALVGDTTTSPFGPLRTSGESLEKFAKQFSFLDSPLPIKGDPEVFVIPGPVAGRLSGVAIRPGLAFSGPDFVQIPVAEGPAKALDPLVVAWARVHVQSGAMIVASNVVIGERRVVRRVEVQVGADHGVLLLSGPGRADPPVAFIGHGDRVYRIDIVLSEDPRVASIVPSPEDVLRQFLATFEALDIER